MKWSHFFNDFFFLQLNLFSRGKSLSRSLVHYSQNSIVFHKGFEEIIFMKSYIPLQGQIFSSCFLTNCIAWGVKAVTLLKISFFVIKIRRNKNIFRPRPISNRIQNMFSKSQNHRHESGRNWERGIRWFCWTGHPQSSKLDSHQYLRLAQIWNAPVVSRKFTGVEIGLEFWLGW